MVNASLNVMAYTPALKQASLAIQSATTKEEQIKAEVAYNKIFQSMADQAAGTAWSALLDYFKQASYEEITKALSDPRALHDLTGAIFYDNPALSNYISDKFQEILYNPDLKRAELAEKNSDIITKMRENYLKNGKFLASRELALATNNPFLVYTDLSNMDPQKIAALDTLIQRIPPEAVNNMLAQLRSGNLPSGGPISADQFNTLATIAQDSSTLPAAKSYIFGNLIVSDSSNNAENLRKAKIVGRLTDEEYNSLSNNKKVEYNNVVATAMVKTLGSKASANLSDLQEYIPIVLKNGEVVVFDEYGNRTTSNPLSEALSETGGELQGYIDKGQIDLEAYANGLTGYLRQQSTPLIDIISKRSGIDLSKSITPEQLKKLEESGILTLKQQVKDVKAMLRDKRLEKGIFFEEWSPEGILKTITDKTDQIVDVAPAAYDAMKTVYGDAFKSLSKLNEAAWGIIFKALGNPLNAIDFKAVKDLLGEYDKEEPLIKEPLIKFGGRPEGTETPDIQRLDRKAEEPSPNTQKKSTVNNQTLEIDPAQEKKFSNWSQKIAPQIEKKINSNKKITADMRKQTSDVVQELWLEADALGINTDKIGEIQENLFNGKELTVGDLSNIKEYIDKLSESARKKVNEQV